MAKAKAAGRALTIEEVLEAKRPATMKVSICLDPELVEARDRAKQVLGGAELLAGRPAPSDDVKAERAAAAVKARADLEEAESAVEAATVVFEFRALGRKVVETLMKVHRPTAAQQLEFKEGLREAGLPATETLSYDPDRFPPALIARACVSPQMSEEQAQELWDSEAFSRGDLGMLFQAAWSVNQITGR